MARSNHTHSVLWLRPRTLVLIGAVALVIGCTNATGQPSTSASGPSPAGMASATEEAAPSMLPMPSGGLSEEQARAVAQKAAPLSAVFVSAEAGPLGSVSGGAQAAAGLSIDASHEIWAVRFAAIAAPCPPGGSTCESPRPGTVTVVLDYFSGQVFVTSGDYPNPAATGQPGPDTSLTCSLPHQDCNDALHAIEVLPALDANGMPPVAVAVVDMSECRTVSGAPQGYAPCAAAMDPPADPSATGDGDALATVTYRDGRGKAFLWLYWWTYASGRGPINAILQAHNP